jgi:pyridoxal 5'-phosphate synthase pdxT subunit
LQGAFEAHGKALSGLGAKAVEVRQACHLEHLDGLIIPGGESSTMLKLLQREDLLEPLRQFGQQRPVFGTCAGAILLATHVTNPLQESLGLMDLTVERNGYGRQLDSCVTYLAPEPEFEQRTSPGELEAVFIRAPVIRGTGPGVRVLASREGDPVLVEQGRHLAATFHPELAPDPRIHELFLEKL